MRSFLDIFDLDTARSRTLHADRRRIEAPNWSPDGQSIWFNGDGRLYRIPAAGGDPVVVDTGFAVELNNDHGVSPDGNLMAISDKTRTGQSCIYLLPASGGEPRRLTPEVPSWWHGWSPDGRAVAYPAVRTGKFGIWEIDIAGGPERLVAGGDGPHYDGPDYTPDGAWIWFNSDRSGAMQLWRVRRDGTGLQQMTFSDSVDWFPHPSPDGRNVLYLAYAAGTEGHPADRAVKLRLISADGGDSVEMVSFHGGQGSVNVPCWSPCSRKFAFMRYAMIPEIMQGD